MCWMKLVMTQANLTLMGGAEKVLLKIAQHYKAPIYTAEYSPREVFDGFRELDVRVIARSRGGLLPYGRAMQGLNYGLSFYNYKIEEDYDVINAHVAPSHWIRNRNARVLWYCHTPLRDIYDLYRYRMGLKKGIQKPIHMVGARAVRLMDQSVVRKIEFIFANSRNTQSRIEKYLHRRDSEVLGAGIEAKEYRNAGSEKYFFYPSRISPNKRQDYAIRAFRRFKRNKAAAGYKLIIAGAVSRDKFYYGYYLKIRNMARGSNDIALMENVSERKLRELYSRAAGVLYTPMNEDYGIAPLEAMASYKPVIAVDEGGPRETIVNRRTGFLVGNEAEMAKKMLWVVENPALAKRMGKEGRTHVETNYSWEAFFSEFDKGLKEVARS